MNVPVRIVGHPVLRLSSKRVARGRSRRHWEETKRGRTPCRAMPACDPVIVLARLGLSDSRPLQSKRQNGQGRATADAATAGFAHRNLDASTWSYAKADGPAAGVRPRVDGGYRAHERKQMRTPSREAREQSEAA